VSPAFFKQKYFILQDFVITLSLNTILPVQ